LMCSPSVLGCSGYGFGRGATSRMWTSGKKATRPCVSIDATNWNYCGNCFIFDHRYAYYYCDSFSILVSYKANEIRNYSTPPRHFDLVEEQRFEPPRGNEVSHVTGSRKSPGCVGQRTYGI
jgi:hypothetical protein